MIEIIKIKLKRLIDKYKTLSNSSSSKLGNLEKQKEELQSKFSLEKTKLFLSLSKPAQEIIKTTPVLKAELEDKIRDALLEKIHTLQEVESKEQNIIASFIGELEDIIDD